MEASKTNATTQVKPYANTGCVVENIFGRKSRKRKTKKKKLSSNLILNLINVQIFFCDCSENRILCAWDFFPFLLCFYFTRLLIAPKKSFQNVGDSSCLLFRFYLMSIVDFTERKQEEKTTTTKTEFEHQILCSVVLLNSCRVTLPYFFLVFCCFEENQVRQKMKEKCV